MSVETHFSNIQSIIIRELNKANRQILIAVAWFTDDLLYNKLEDALELGIKVNLILNDDDINQFSGLNFENLVNKGAEIYLYDSNEDTMHQKFCVIDHDIVLAGSYNWTKRAANRNTENLIVFNNERDTALNFKKQFEELITKSKKFLKKQKFNTSSNFIIDDFTPITAKIVEKSKIDLFDEDVSQDFPNPNLIPFRVDDKWGFCDKNRNIKIPLLFDEARQYSEGIAAVSVNMKWGFIDSEGKKICDCNYKKVQDFRNGYASVLSSNSMENWGSIDRKGNMVIPFVYGFCGDFRDGLFCVYTNGMSGSGYVDKRNKKVIPLEYQHGWDFSEKKAGVCRKSISNKGTYVYDHIFIDRNNQMLFDKSFTNLNSFNQGYAPVYYTPERDILGKHGLINSNGEYVIKPQYSGISYMYSDGLIAVSREYKKPGGIFGDNLWGYVDTNNIEVIPFKFGFALPFSNNRAAVEHPDNKKYGYIDLKGRLVVDYIFDDAKQFKNNLARVNIGGHYGRNGFIDVGCNGYIDVNGNQYWEH